LRFHFSTLATLEVVAEIVEKTLDVMMLDATLQVVGEVLDMKMLDGCKDTTFELLCDDGFRGGWGGGRRDRGK
jgi:hypothetical protein